MVAEDINHQWCAQGFGIMPAVCTRQQAAELLAAIQKAITFCVTDLACTRSDYLSAVSRWVMPSPLTKPLGAFVSGSLRPYLAKQIGRPVSLVKMNVISKTRYAAMPIPCHQDIAYSPHSPYEFTLWLALNDVPLDAGALQFLPGTHLEEIVEAVDFWQPNYVDSMANTDRWQKHHRSFPVKAGDGILFDARIWHGSHANRSGQERFALVTRWRSEGYQPPMIPPIQPTGFGMWTCQPPHLESFISGVDVAV